jgi:hypothetical protein
VARDDGNGNGIETAMMEEPEQGMTRRGLLAGAAQAVAVERPHLWHSESERGSKEAVLFSACNETNNETRKISQEISHWFNLTIPVELNECLSS